MGWQDREYARPRYAGPSWSGPSKGKLIGGSIVTTLIVINVAIFVLENMFPAVRLLLSGDVVRSSFGVIQYQHGYADMWARGVMHGQVWRLITAQYLHAGIGHIFINMLVLHFLGRALERMWSAKRFFTVYTLCGLFGNIFYTILGSRLESLLDSPAVGASGSIYGLLGIVAVLFPQATVYIYFLFPMKIRTAAMIFAGISFFTILQRGSNFGGEACHLAGLVFGVWWAMKGDAWWSQTQWGLPGVGSFRRSAGKTKQPRGFKAKVEQRREDEETIDRILKKVYDGGIHSLSESEKRQLQEATDRRREREAQAGRVDRI